MGDDADRIVAAYLHSRGFVSAESALRQEAKIKPLESLQDEARMQAAEASIPEFILFYNESEMNNPSAYKQSYGRLRKWVEDSLEKYRMELSSVLFPIFVHAYIDLVTRGIVDQARLFMDAYQADHMEAHGADVVRLSSVTSPALAQENDLVRSFITNRYCVRMSRYSFELLLAFLQDNKFMLLTRLVNGHISIKVDHQRPGMYSALDDATGLTGLTFSEMETFNQQPVSLGLLPPDPWVVSEIESALTQNRMDVGEMRDELLSNLKREPPPDAPARETVPLPNPKFSDILREIESFKELKARINLDRTTLPSICCYTFHNTYEGLSSLRMSDDSTLAIAGFNDSFVRVWSLKGDKLKDDSDCVSLIGHSGPVYGAALSRDNKFALTSSEDSTARLWSLQTFSNLAVYKSHNYPIWDLDLSQDNVYFATGSYDRTIRLWRTDIINPLRIFIGHNSDINSVRFHPNCNYIASGSSDSQVRLWNIQKGNCVRLMKSHIESVQSLAFSPDGRTLASAGEDCLIKLWDLGSGKLIKTMTGHSNVIYSLAFSRDGNQLVSGSADNTVRIWDPKTADATELKREPGGRLKALDASPDQLGVFPTKKTPVFHVQYTRSNVVLAAGPYLGGSA
ncbi:WD40-repeat-containing domain protein [Zopfochytrium polystomum]|nr:WD40-repeat-containing domain protein [Zopfochytrium polystomum]